MDPISKLTIHISKPKISVEDKLQRICMTVSKLIPKANRVSLWQFSDDLSEIKSLSLLNEKRQFVEGGILTRQVFPSYFDYILTHEVLQADNARAHPSTSCFNELYFEPNNIYSLLDFIFYNDLEPVGIICCEVVGGCIEWQEADIATLKRIANISTTFIAKEIND